MDTTSMYVQHICVELVGSGYARKSLAAVIFLWQGHHAAHSAFLPRQIWFLGD